MVFTNLFTKAGLNSSYTNVSVFISVRNHNKKAAGVDKIKSVLCPGLGTAVGLMPKVRCANQVGRYTV